MAEDAIQAGVRIAGVLPGMDGGSCHSYPYENTDSHEDADQDQDSDSNADSHGDTYADTDSDLAGGVRDAGLQGQRPDPGDGAVQAPGDTGDPLRCEAWAAALRARWQRSDPRRGSSR